MGADIECKRGNYQEAITTMEDLLRRKKFDAPPLPAAIAESPAGRAPESAAAILMR
jgi:hypothetical protein